VSDSTEQILTPLDVEPLRVLPQTDLRSLDHGSNAAAGGTPLTLATPSMLDPNISLGYGTNDGISAARQRYELRDFGTLLSDRRGLIGCGRKIGKGRAGSSSEIVDRTIWCRCVWLCPVCGYNASQKHLRKVQRRLRSWTAQGGAVAFLTLTQSHCLSDSLAVLWDRMEVGWTALVRGSRWRAHKQTHGLAGYFRITEVVWNSLKGWNVHFHVILLLDAKLNQLQLDALEASLSERFADGLALTGGSASGHPQDLKPVTPGSEERLATYCSKGTTIKTSTNGSRTPMAILHDLKSSDEELSEQLEMDKDGVRRHLQALADLGFVSRDALDCPASDPQQPESPMPPCRRCGKPADGLDHLCTRCRAIWACDQLVKDRRSTEGTRRARRGRTFCLSSPSLLLTLMVRRDGLAEPRELAEFLGNTENHLAKWRWEGKGDRRLRGRTVAGDVQR
jgi:hypothetical protein